MFEWVLGLYEKGGRGEGGGRRRKEVKEGKRGEEGG